MSKTKKKIFLGFLIVLAMALVGFRLYLPTLIKNKANETLSKIPGYRGHIDDVTLHLWRGAYSIEGLKLLKLNGEVPVPFVGIPVVDFSIAWKPLFRGNLSGKVELDDPKINFVAGGPESQQQTSIDKSWKERVKELFPLRIARLGIKNGEIHFRNYHAEPQIDIFIRKINVVATNLTNSLRFSNTLKATIEGDAVAMTNGDIHFETVTDPFAPKPTFKLEVELKHLALPELNAWFRHYLAVNMKMGNLSVYTEGAADQGKFVGYIKPLLERADLVKVKENASLGEALKGLGVKIVAYIIKNHPKDRLATRIDIKGDIDNPQVDTWTAFTRFLKNWIIKAIPPGLQGNVTLKNAREQKLPDPPTPAPKPK